ncbi:MAG: globin domain-containing protein [Streptosporangiaceae bacterium]
MAILIGNNGVGGPNPSSRELDNVVSEAEPPVLSSTEAITHTFSLVSRAGDGAVAYFYGRLFAENPELRPMFPAAMDAQRDRLFRALARIVHSLSTPEQMEPYLSQLGLDHRKYGVLTEHYPAVGQALLATLRRFSGDAWTPGAEAAWAGAYERATQLMTAAADKSAEHSPPWWPAEVVGHELRTPTLAVLTLRPEEPFPYLAGQYLSIQSAHWHRVWRPFSVANAPRADGLLTFHVRAVPGGWVSSALVHHTRVGDQVNLGPPQGSMTLAAGSGGGMFCVAGGSGLAPLKALVEQAIADSQPGRRRRIRLIVGARRESELYDLPDLWRLESYYPWLRISTAVSDDPDYTGVKGMLSDIIARQLPQKDDNVYISGPSPMVTKCTQVLRAKGPGNWRIHADPVDPPNELAARALDDSIGHECASL